MLGAELESEARLLELYSHSEPSYSKEKLSQLFDQVYRVNRPSDLKELATTYSKQIDFGNDTAMKFIFSCRFLRAQGEVEKKNWAIFCVHSIFKKEYPAIENWKEWIDESSTLFQSLEGFERYNLDLKKVIKIKEEEFRAKELMSLIVIGRVKEAVLCHEWFTTSENLLIEMEKAIKLDPSKIEVIDACNYMIKVLPSLPFNPPEKKLILHIYQNAPDCLQKDELKILREVPKVVPLIPQRQDGGVVDFDAKLDIIMSIHYAGEDIETQLSLFAVDLASKGVALCNKIHLSEFSRLNWAKNTELPLNQLIKYFDMISAFVVKKILSFKKVKHRSAAIAFFIKLAGRSNRLYDLNSSYAILTALESTEIGREKKAWALIDPKIIEKRDALNEFFSFKKNFKTFRSSLRKYDTSRQAYVPFVAPLLRDLTFAEEGNPNEIEGVLNQNKIFVLTGILGQFFDLQEILRCPEELKTDLVQQIIPANF